MVKKFKSVLAYVKKAMNEWIVKEMAKSKPVKGQPNVFHLNVRQFCIPIN